MNNYDQEYLEDVANTIIKSESYMNDEELMKAVKPVVDEIRASADRLKGFDFKSMRELAGKKELEEKAEYESKSPVGSKKNDSDKEEDPDTKAKSAYKNPAGKPS